MSARIRHHIRSNVLGWSRSSSPLVAPPTPSTARFRGRSGRLRGHHQRGGEGAPTLASDAVRSGEVLDETTRSASTSPPARSHRPKSSTTPSPTSISEATRSPTPELDPHAFNPAEIAEVAPGFAFGIADDSIQSEEVSANSLTGSDVATNSLTGTDIDETTLSALDGNDAHDQSCYPETATFLHCVELSFTAGQPIPVLMMATYQYHGVDDDPLGKCRTTLDGATISIAKLYNSDHTSRDRR